MQIVYHLGAHCTDEDRLVRSLLKNRGILNPQGIVIPPPRLYRQILPKMAQTLKDGPAEAETQKIILDAVMEEDEAKRLIFSHDFLIGYPRGAISEHGLYRGAPQRVVALSNLFPDAETEFHLALRNPATLIPALIARIPDASYQSVMGDTNPMDLRWVPVIRRILAALPGIDLTVWCNEDTPLIWPELLRNLAGLGHESEMEGDYDLLAAIMSEAGLSRLQAFMQSHPPRSRSQRRRNVAAFLDKFALTDEIEMEIPLPGWTDDLVAAVTATYEADVAEIKAMAGVDFIDPS
ncbi:MAG: hypothetical protein KDE11_03750 [Rhodobacteraceae bacterium]|nr:hypothetical protein [Paracoccaceae bacterium]